MTDIFPDVVRIEASGVCNFRCKHCSSAQRLDLGGRGRGFLSVELFDTLIAQFEARKFVPRVVVLYHGGEPFLNKNFFYFVEKIKALGAYIKITSNASVLTPDLAEKLVKSGLDRVVFSFDGASPEENDEIRVGADFWKDSQNVLDLLELKEKTGSSTPEITISNVRILSADELAQARPQAYDMIEPPEYLLERFADYDVKQVSFPAMVWPAYEKTEKFRYETLSLPQMPMYCPTTSETISVLCNGDVVPCCNDLNGDIVLGNINDDTIFDIWENEKFTQFRKCIANGTPDDFCKKCMLYNNEYIVSL